MAQQELFESGIEMASGLFMNALRFLKRSWRKFALIIRGI